MQDGASLAYVRDQLGHSSISVTLDLYGHLAPSANIAWVDRLDGETSQQQNATPAQLDKDQDHEESLEAVDNDGGPGRSRTADQRFRKPLLYPTELRGRNQFIIACRFSATENVQATNLLPEECSQTDYPGLAFMQPNAG